MIHKKEIRAERWLLFFYSAPSNPVNNRVKVWRKLTGAGAAQLKGGVYALPYSEERHEFLQWLTAEVVAVGGEAGLVRAREIEGIPDSTVEAAFNAQREDDYRAVEEALDELEARLAGDGGGQDKTLVDGLGKAARMYDDIKNIDFFGSDKGRVVAERLAKSNERVRGLQRNPSTATVVVAKVRKEDYRDRRWVTRENPFVDRMACAWLIRRFIDKDASFVFMDEEGLKGLGSDVVTFDVTGGAFTHVGEMCTFEVMVKAFGVRDKVVREIAGLVRALDIKGDSPRPPDADGVEAILRGVRKSAKDDTERLEKGAAVFEALYWSKKS